MRMGRSRRNTDFLFLKNKGSRQWAVGSGGKGKKQRAKGKGPRRGNGKPRSRQRLDGLFLRFAQWSATNKLNN
jgi:hypothetical protein